MRKFTLLTVLVMVVFPFLASCDLLPVCDTPQIALTIVPPVGSFENLHGTVCGVDPTTSRVVVYIKVYGTWWLKPTVDSPLTAIDWFGNWSCDITTGGVDEEATDIVAYVVSASYNPDINTLPTADQYLAAVSVNRQ